MKNVKLKILGTIWLSIILVCAIFAGVINLIIPSHFEKEAKNALKYEMEYIDRSANNNDSDDDYEGTFLSGNINFIDFYEEENKRNGVVVKSGDVNSSSQNSEAEIKAHYSLDDLKIGSIITLKTTRGYYVFVKYKDVFELGEKYRSTIMYINIQPIVKYMRSLNWIFGAIFLAIAVAMSIIGLRLGKQIENDHDANHKFFQNSSHELKTPLMAIQGYAEGIQQGIVDTSSSAEIIINESEKMAEMIDSMLSISKIDANQLTLNFTVSDLREILYDCMRSVEPILQNKNITATPLFTGSPVWVRCDESQLSKVFTNVLTNGIRHCKSTLVILCNIEEKAAVVKIKDDGDGIAIEDIPHLFDRFYSGMNGNTGIGLALSQEIVNIHNGSIKAYNEVGAVFEIRLPIFEDRRNK